MVNISKLIVLFFVLSLVNVQSSDTSYSNNKYKITKNSVVHFSNYHWHINSDLFEFQVQNLCEVIGLNNYKITSSTMKSDEELFFKFSSPIPEERLLNSAYNFFSGGWFYRKNVLQGKINLSRALIHEKMYKNLYKLNIVFHPPSKIKFINVKSKNNLKTIDINSSIATLTLTGDEIVNSRIFIHPENDIVNTYIHIIIFKIYYINESIISFKSSDLNSNSLQIKTNCDSSVFTDIYFYE